jgi:hypothetical protein
MAEVKTSKGIVLMDDEIKEKIEAEGFRIVDNGLGYPNLVIPLHRYVMGKPPIGMVIDHINRNPMDARKDNLRHTTATENSLNIAPRNGKKYKGVIYSKTKGTWFVSTSFKGHKIRKAVKNEIDAALLYDFIVKYFHGENTGAYLNFPSNNKVPILSEKFMNSLAKLKASAMYRNVIVEECIYLRDTGRYRVQVSSGIMLLFCLK